MKKQIICGVVASMLVLSGGGATLGNAADLNFDLIASAAVTKASGTCGAKVTWTLDDEGTLTISGTGEMANYWSTVKQPWAKYSNFIKKAVIEEGVTKIGSFAFNSCTNLTSITIPNGVKYIGECAFRYCKNLSTVTIPDGVTGIDNNVFEGCTNLSSITIPDSVKSFDSEAFKDCSSLKSITIPNGVTYLWYGAFMGCKSLEQVTLPDTLKSIGGNEFSNCSSLKSITIPNSVKEICNDAFYNCSRLKSITIPNGVTKINGNAFLNCTSLSSVTIPDSVTSIGANAFQNCTALSDINIPNRSISIGKNAFRSCTKLLSVTIPENVTSIGDKAFGYNDSGRIQNFKIRCYKGTAGEKYAKQNNLSYTLLDDKVNPMPTAVPGECCVTLSWGQVEKAEKYAIVVNVNEEWVIVEKTTENTYKLCGLEPSSKYRVAVISMFNGEWYTNFSDAITVTPNAPVYKYPTVTDIEYNEEFHQFRLTWNAVKGAEEYGVAVKIAGKWKVHTCTNKTSFTSPKLRPGSIAEMVICAKVNGEWDTTAINSRSFSVTVK
ncbi:leucine-rich repeat domain-containing protein [Ruminococcus albus]|uniref:Leucine rich repeat-containing protein n=1 Tax=Ruminococcus albus TaxID=1264 RepID=A0A1H7GY73_RUMAL|nr:leucine-rich repeat domain-containing protein [Ruminococcus albus]SEK43106.1 Leucine rich repeat-containing protein [Ruminococcus albus]